MADQERNTEEYDLRQSSEIDQGIRTNDADYREETSAEIAAPVSLGRREVRTTDDEVRREAGGTGIGYAALALSILSLFISPLLFGAAGIILGFFAKRRGADTLGSWAIGIGVISIIVGMFIVPFF